MNEKYVLWIDNAACEPLTKAEIVVLLYEQKVTPDTLCSGNAGESWIPVHQMLAAKAERPSAASAAAQMPTPAAPPAQAQAPAQSPAAIPPRPQPAAPLRDTSAAAWRLDGNAASYWGIGRTTWIAGLCALAALALLILAFASGAFTSAQSLRLQEEEKKRDAVHSLVVRHVTAQLRPPVGSQVVFPNKNEMGIRSDSSIQYVRGWVLSPGPSGAMQRAEFTCVVENGVVSELIMKQR
ncbi:hypothetical protein DB346_18050 [Verrucomicrobia bacterium LW23]|nr:hypothetical protein DB346_18050 [Verrucomicrobia bacterium LW23]